MRTEEQVLKDFEKLGLLHLYIVDGETPYKALILEDEEGEEIRLILNNKEIKLSNFKSINFEELKLLTELFKIWGWLND